MWTVNWFDWFQKQHYHSHLYFTVSSPPKVKQKDLWHCWNFPDVTCFHPVFLIKHITVCTKTELNLLSLVLLSCGCSDPAELPQCHYASVLWASKRVCCQTPSTCVTFKSALNCFCGCANLKGFVLSVWHRKPFSFISVKFTVWSN